MERLFFKLKKKTFPENFVFLMMEEITVKYYKINIIIFFKMLKIFPRTLYIVIDIDKSFLDWFKISSSFVKVNKNIDY